jgi:hypothetical protein
LSLFSLLPILSNLSFWSVSRTSSSSFCNLFQLFPPPSQCPSLSVEFLSLSLSLSLFAWHVKFADDADRHDFQIRETEWEQKSRGSRSVAVNLVAVKRTFITMNRTTSESRINRGKSSTSSSKFSESCLWSTSLSFFS